MKMWGFLFLASSLLLSPKLFAEYRIFNLQISNPAEPLDLRQTLSTLDPEQYRTYYHVKPNYKISYTETWMCKGRTVGLQPPCPNPRAPAGQATTAATPSSPPPAPAAGLDQQPNQSPAKP